MLSSRTGIPKLVVAANKVANLLRRAAGHRELPSGIPRFARQQRKTRSALLDALKTSTPSPRKSARLDPRSRRRLDPLANLMTKTVNSAPLRGDFVMERPRRRTRAGSRESVWIPAIGSGWYDRSSSKSSISAAEPIFDAYATANFAGRAHLYNGPQGLLLGLQLRQGEDVCGRKAPTSISRASRTVHSLGQRRRKPLWPSKHTSTGIVPFGQSLIAIGGPRGFWQYNCPL